MKHIKNDVESILYRLFSKKVHSLILGGQKTSSNNCIYLPSDILGSFR